MSGHRPIAETSRDIRITAGPVILDGTLVVGGRDEPVIGMNREARKALRCESALEIVPEATHLFEEPGKLEAVARLARDWFLDHLRPPAV